MKGIEEYKIFVKARKLQTYFKGEVLPFIHFCCRKNMTTGDIDGFIWDYKLKKYYIIEQKHNKEARKDSQIKHLKFLDAQQKEIIKSERFKNYDFGVFIITGDPPYTQCEIEKIDCDKYIPAIKINQETLKAFLNMDLNWNDIDKQARANPRQTLF